MSAEISVNVDHTGMYYQATMLTQHNKHS